MARALLGHVGTPMGHVGTPREHVLVSEVVRLRRRVAELESELAELRTAQHTLPPTEVLDLELHRMAEAPEPALA